MKANMKLNRLLSLLLALVMVVGLLPAMGQVAYAYSEGDIAGTTGSGASKEDPVVCDTFAEFKAAMENTEITYVKLTGASGAMPSRETLGAAISNTTYKVLTIEGTNKFWSPLNGNNDCLIWPRNELTINGTGTLKYEHGNTGGTGAVINMASNVSLKIDGNVTLEGGANGSSFGYAIFAQAGTTKINGGSFIGYSADITSNADVSAVIINSSANLTINGGNFSASLHQNSPEGKKAHSLSITSTATGAISIKEGTFPQGINIKARGKTIENCGYFDTAKASITADGNAVATTASTNVLNGKNVVVTDTSIIASVAVAVTEPVAGAQPQNGVSNTDNVTVTITEWYHNGVKMLATDTFAAGETYKVHVIVKPNSGYEFADNPTATFNGSTAGTIYMYGKDYINYYAEFTATTEPIGSVDVTITKPVAGAQPQNGVSNTDNVTVTITEWYHNGVKMLATDTFAAGETYKVHVIVKPNSGYEFADNPTATFNGSTAGTIYMYGKDYINYYAEFTVPAASTPTTIDTVAISVTAPTAGAAPVVEPAGLPTGVTCEPVLTTVTGWYDSETNTKMASTEKFVEGKTYYICLFLSADTGYSFANPITTATINGDNATIELNNDGYLAIKKSFVASASATTIDTIAVTVTVPVAGAAPVVAPAGLPTGVTCEPVLTTVTGWYDSETNTKMASTEKFVEGKTYYICLFLSADTGYAFANPVTTATINGVDATIELNNDGHLAIKKSFVATAAATTEYDITVTDGKATIGAGTEISKAAEGTTVTLTANAASDGMIFDKWVVEDGSASITLADATSATTTFTMPAGAVSVKATYKDKPVTTYTVTVNGSYASTTGAGSYNEGDTVNIYAGSRSGYTFDGWTSSNVTITDADSRNASFLMPDNDVTVTAHWTRNAVPVTPTEPSTYTIKVEKTDNGDVTVSHKSASKGTTVTLTVEPDEGYTLETLTVTDKNGDEIRVKEKNGKYTFTMPASKVYVEATFMEDNSMLNFFVDVPADAYYYDAVLWAAKNGITGGVDDTHFAPNATCTRAQAVTFLWRAAGSPAPKSDVNPFTDVKAGSYYYDAVLWAMENGITKGTSDTMFSPDATCSRGQIVTFLWRSQKSPASDSANPFADVAADAYYNTAVLWAVTNGITDGTSATTFSPAANCTRAQIVTFLYRCLG